MEIDFERVDINQVAILNIPCSMNVPKFIIGQTIFTSLFPSLIIS